AHALGSGKRHRIDPQHEQREPNAWALGRVGSAQAAMPAVLEQPRSHGGPCAADDDSTLPLPAPGPNLLARERSRSTVLVGLAFSPVACGWLALLLALWAYYARLGAVGDLLCVWNADALYPAHVYKDVCVDRCPLSGWCLPP